MKRRLAAGGSRLSALQIPLLEPLRRRAERAELIDGCTRWRERELRERFGDHLIEVGRRRVARADGRIELRAGSDLLETSDVLDEGRVDRWVVVRGRECADGAGGHHQRLRRRDDLRLQLQELRRRRRDDAGDAEPAAGRDVVPLRSFELPGVGVGGDQHVLLGGVELLQVRRAHETLKHRRVGNCFSPQAQGPVVNGRCGALRGSQELPPSRWGRLESGSRPDRGPAQASLGGFWRSAGPE